MRLPRQLLERVPIAEKTDWKPHAKSMTLGALANHVAHIAAWTVPTLRQDSFDVMPQNGESVTPPPATDSGGLLSAFDRYVTESRQAIDATTDDEMTKPWTLLAGGKAVFTMPKVAVFRGMIMNHLIHHRAQLGLYLRLNDVALPSTYGPSADDSGM